MDVEITDGQNGHLGAAAAKLYLHAAGHTSPTICGGLELWWWYSNTEVRGARLLRIYGFPAGLQIRFGLFVPEKKCK